MSSSFKRNNLPNQRVLTSSRSHLHRTANFCRMSSSSSSNEAETKENKALRSWVDADARNHALPADYAAPENAAIRAKFDLLVRDLHSWIDVDLIWSTLKAKKSLDIYWGTATTGRPHVGYFVPMNKIADFLRAGCNVTILFADVHGYLDNMKSDWPQLANRCAYYEFVIRLMLKCVGVDSDATPEQRAAQGYGKLSFIRGSTYQLERNYTLDMYRMCVQVTSDHAKGAGAEVVKQASSPLMSSLLYPILQALDEEYLKVDVQFGGVDQRKIFMFARDHMPKLGYAKRGYFMNPLIPGLGKSGKMSSSEPLSKIDFDDSPDVLQKKIRLAYCESTLELSEGTSVADAMCNGVLALTKFVIFPFLKQSATAPYMQIKDVKYYDYGALAADYESGRVHPSELKPVVAGALTALLAPLRDALSASGAGYKVLLDAYPDVVEKRLKDEKALEASRKGATTVASLKLIVGVVADNVTAVSPTLNSADVYIGLNAPIKVVSEFVQPNAKLMLLANVGPSFPLKGVKSDAQVMYVEAESRREALRVPTDAVAGAAVEFDGYPGAPEETLKKQWAKLAEKLKTDEYGVPIYVGLENETVVFKVNNAPCPPVSLKSAPILKA